VALPARGRLPEVAWLSTPTIVVLLLVAPVTVLVLLVAGRWLVRRARAAYHEATRSYERLQPLLDQLEHDGEVARRELERLDEGMARLAAAREERRGR
jgi:hypothetical protein